MRLLRQTEEACLAACGCACHGPCVRPEMAECFRALIECAEVCRRCDEAIEHARELREPQASPLLWCRFCAVVCESCAAQCEQHATEGLRRCAELCRQAARECRSLATEGSKNKPREAKPS